MAVETERDGWPFSYVDRIRFGDLDAMRHLNNVAFLGFFESARIAFIQSLVASHSPVETEHKVGLIFAEAHINYRSPGLFDEEVRTFIRPRALERSSFRTEFLMTSETDGRTLAEGWGALVGYDYVADKSTPISEPIAEALRASGGEAEPEL